MILNKNYESRQLSKSQQNSIELEVKITDVEVIEGNSWFGMGSYANFKIESRGRGVPNLENEKVYSVKRRFNEFKGFHQYLTSNSKFKGLIIPQLPPDTWIKNYNDEFLNERRQELEKYL